MESGKSCLRQARLLGNISLGSKTSEILRICCKHGNFKRCLLKTQDYCSNQSQDHAVFWLQSFGRDHCKLTNLNLKEWFALNVALRMYTRRTIIQERVEDLQLGVKNYQKKINLLRPESYRSDLKKITPYIAYPDIQGIIYQDDMDRNS
ncbi:hypothetical protein Tco_0345409 [Tanacetum coccineum]